MKSLPSYEEYNHDSMVADFKVMPEDVKEPEKTVEEETKEVEPKADSETGAGAVAVTPIAVPEIQQQF